MGDMSSVHANLSDGILTVHAPKKFEVEPVRVTIPIQTGSVPDKMELPIKDDTKKSSPNDKPQRGVTKPSTHETKEQCDVMNLEKEKDINSKDYAAEETMTGSCRAMDLKMKRNGILFE